MGDLSPSLQEKLLALGRDFRHKLSSRIEGIVSIRAALRVGRADRARLSELRVEVHKLAGAGATFGFRSLSERSRRFETLLDGMISEDAPLSSELLDEVDRHVSELMALEQAREPENEMEIFTAKGGSAKWAPSKKTLLLFDHDVEVVKDLSRQLGYFGYTVQRLASLTELEEAAGEGAKHLALLDASVLEEDPKAQELLARLKAKMDDRLTLMFTSRTDDFETRLRVVRAGGDAYFLKPYDVGKLIDRMETLSVERESVPYHILIVDDDPEQVAYYALVLQQAGMITSVALDPKRVIAVLNEAKPELVLMDMYMPGCNGMELASIIRQHEAFVGIPIVFLSVETDLDRQLAAIQLGGDDFLTKPIKPEHLVLSITTRAARTRNIRYFLERDSLTGLLNHTNLKEQLAREVVRAARLGAPVSFAMIDVDHFKNVNDTYGHLTGDGVLRSLSRLLQERLRRTDIIGRYGGEEFGVILLNTKSDVAARIMDEIRDNFSRISQQADGEEFFVTFSCGVASFPEIKEAGALNAGADYALYEAKETGRNRVVITSEFPAT